MAIKSKKIEKFLKYYVTLHVFDEIDSTNNEAKRRFNEDRGKIALYVTDFQTAGRGRRGHDFYSPRGSGLYFTLALPLSAEPAEMQVTTCAAAIAICEGIEALCGKAAQIKWVNDVCLDGKKVAGILTELVSDETNQPVSVIIGIGINLTTEHFPAEFAEKAGSVGKVDPNHLCAEIVNRLILMYDAINNSELELKYRDNSSSELKYGFNSILEKYKQLNFCIGMTVRYTDTDGSHTAAAVDIADDGSLIVEENGVRKQLHSGEISITPTI